ncbi:MAG: hypothetical protein RL661_967 [Pseudomonadota bacterium]|jgi:hypothetical protein
MSPFPKETAFTAYPCSDFFAIYLPLGSPTI